MATPPRVGLLFEVLEWAYLLQNAQVSGGLGLTVDWEGELPTLRGEGLQVPVSRSNYSPGIAISLEELKQEHDIEWAFRVGTCGGYHESMCVGDIVLVTAAIRGEGTSRCYVSDPGFPAAADIEASSLLLPSLARAGVPVHTGIVWTTDGRIAGSYDKRVIDGHRRNRVLGVDMESAAFFTVAHRLGIRAANVSVVLDLPEKDGKYSEVEAGKQEDIALAMSRSMAAVAAALRTLRDGYVRPLPSPGVRQSS